MAATLILQPLNQHDNGVDATQLLPAAQDFRYLLGKGYPRQASLVLVGNRYDLPWAARQILQRGVFNPEVAGRRRLKLWPVRTLGGRPLALDGHNVVITLECALRGVPVMAADDGFIRDIGQISHKFRPSAMTEQALLRLSRYLAAHEVGPVTFWYDAPMSRSGDLAATTRRIMHSLRLSGDAHAVSVPEKMLLEYKGAIGSSDTYLIDRCELMVDVAGEIIREMPGVRIVALKAEGPGKHVIA
jgi:hypothetical protein